MPAASAESTLRLPRLSEAEESRARSLEGRLKCPVCRTQSVLESTSFMALEMRAKIRELIASGKSDREILDYFVDRYGDYILLEPRKAGFALSAYLLPALAVLGGCVFLLLALRRAGSRRRGVDGASHGDGRASAQSPKKDSAAPAETPAAPEILSPADSARVEEELKRYTI